MNRDTLFLPTPSNLVSLGFNGFQALPWVVPPKLQGALLTIAHPTDIQLAPRV